MTRLLYIGYIMLTVFTGLPHAVYAQPLDPSKKLTQYNVDKWSGEGLVSSGIMQMTQSKDGYLWLATFNGLVRFDGVTFTPYDRYNVKEFSASGFRSIYSDRHGNLWIGGNGGGLYLKDNDGFTRYEVPFGPSSNNIKKIFRDSRDNLWLGTLKGLVKFDGSKFSLITAEGYSEAVDMTVYDIEEDTDGTLWVGTAVGVMKYSNGRLFLAGTEDNHIDDEVLSLLLDGKRLWVSSYNKGIYWLEDGVFKKPEELAAVWHPVSLFQDRHKSVWIGSEAGVARYNEYGLSFINAATGLSHNTINTITEDHEGSIWIGTYYGGLNRLRDGAFTNYTILNGLSDNTVHCIYQSPDSTIWVGTESGLNRYENGRFISYNRQGLENAKIRDVFVDSKKNLWVATYSGVVKVSGATATKFTIDDGLSSNQTRLVFEDQQHRIWVGTRSGLNLYNKGKWEVFSIKDGLTNDFITSMIPLNQDEVLIGTTGGLMLMNGKSFKPFQPVTGGFNSTVFRMYKDKDGMIWIGTNRGLAQLYNGRFHSFASDHKLLGANIFEVVEDDQGTFWLTSDIGVIKISRKSLIERISSDTTILSPVLFDKSNGLRSNEITGVAKSQRTFDGSIWFPTLEGVAVLDPDHILINEIPPPLVIDKVLVAGEDYGTSGTIMIPPNSKNIEIHYTGLSFMIPKKVRFKYMLEGYDDDWNNVGDRRIAYYTSLPPGEYTFKLAACNNDGIWNVSEQALELVVEKAFWQTNIFYTFSAVGIAILVFGIVDFRTRRVKQLNRDLEDKITARTREVLLQKEEIEAQRDYIESKNRELEKARNVIARQYEDLQEINENLEVKVEERTMELQKAYRDLIRANKELDDFVYKSAHDIKGPLARLQGLCNLALLESGDTTANRYIKKLQRESILANRILEKLSHAHAVKNMRAEAAAVQLYELMQHVLKMLKNVEATEKVHFKIDIAGDLILVSDSKLLKELFYNVLENAVIFRADEKPEVHVSAILLGSDVIITITDNGTPVDEEVRSDIFKMFVKGSERSEGLGLGLYIAKKAAEGLQGTIVLKKSEGKGNVFVISIPRDLTNVRV